MKKVWYKYQYMKHCIIIIQYAFLCLLCTPFCMYANDITQFSSDENSSFLHTPSTSELQTSIELTRNTKVRESQNAQQISLLRKANTQRNGVYLMVVGNVIPIQRLAGNETIVGYSMGMGLRSGVISYLDNYIGIRGYFALDFTNDKLSPIKKQQDSHNGTFLMASLGVDILIDFFIGKQYKNTMGFFIGVGAGALVYFDLTTPIIIPNAESINTKITANVMVQGGISTVLSYKHRIEVGVRFLPTQSLGIEIDGILADYNFYMGYSYKF